MSKELYKGPNLNGLTADQRAKLVAGANGAPPQGESQRNKLSKPTAQLTEPKSTGSQTS